MKKNGAQEKFKLKLTGIILLLLSFAFLLFVSCGKYAGEQKKKVKIRYLSFEWTHEQVALIKKVIEAFEKKYPHIQVQLETNPEAMRQILMELAARTPPDVFYVTTWDFGSLADKKVLRDLTPYIERDKIDLSIYYPQTVEGLTYEGKLYAFPLHFSTNALFYNKDLFDKAGVKYPDETWTWKDMEKTAAKLSKDTDGDGKIDQFGMLVPDFRVTLVSEGGSLFNKEGTKCTVNSPEAKKIINWGISLRGKEAPTIIQLQDTRDMDLFANNRLAMFVGRTWQLAQLSKTMGTIRWDVAPVPKGGKKRFSLLAVGGHCIPVDSKHPDEAWEFVKFFSSVEGQRLLGIQKNCVPAIKEIALDTACFLSPPPENIKVFIDALEYSYLDVPTKPWNSEFFSKVYSPIFEEINLGRISVEQGLKKMEKEADELIKKYSK